MDFERSCRAERRVECDTEVDLADTLRDVYWLGHGPRVVRRLLVLVVGLVERFYPLSTLRHIVAPAAKAGYQVDYYVALSRGNPAPLQYRAKWYAPVPNPFFENYSANEIEEYVVAEAKSAGARRVGVVIKTSERLEPLPMRIFLKRRWMGEKVAWDAQGVHIHPNLGLALMRFRKLEELWNWTAGHRQQAEYDHVVWTRSDAWWYEDLDIRKFPDPMGVYGRSRGYPCKQEPGDPAIGDHSYVVGGRVAQRFLTPLSAYMWNPSRRLQEGVGSIETFLERTAELAGARVVLVPMGAIPMLHMMHRNVDPFSAAKGSPVVCIRGVGERDVLSPNCDCFPIDRLGNMSLCDDMPLL